MLIGAVGYKMPKQASRALTWPLIQLWTNRLRTDSWRPLLRLNMVIVGVAFPWQLTSVPLVVGVFI
jgi:hypothetical protein